MNLQKYNQRLLAIIGTMVMVALGGIILIGAVVWIIDVIGDIKRQNIQDNSLTIDQVENNGKDEIIRDQEITFESPILIDTLKTIYLIPVSQVNLENPERVNRSNKMFDSYEVGQYSNNYRYSGSYNNLIIYNQNKGTKDLIFHEKTDISSFQNHKIKGQNYILMYGANKDTNGDKKLNYDDLKSLFVYDVVGNKLKEFSFDGMGLIHYYIMNNSYEVILQYAKDKDKNGEVDEYREPSYLKSLSLDTYQITDLVNPNMVKDIQRLID